MKKLPAARLLQETGFLKLPWAHRCTPKHTPDPPPHETLTCNVTCTQICYMDTLHCMSEPWIKLTLNPGRQRSKQRYALAAALAQLEAAEMTCHAITSGAAFSATQPSSRSTSSKP